MVKVYEAPLTDFQPDPANANQGTERGSYMVRQSLEEIGAARSLVADKNNILAIGNKTQEAAVDKGIERAIVVETTGDQMVIVKRTDWDLMDEDPNNVARRGAYFDNRSGQVGLEWDADRLLADLDAGVDLGAMFRDGEIAEILAGLEMEEPADDPGAQIDKAAELQEKWNVQRGQVYEIGRHRLMCGDSTVAGDVQRLMGGERASAIVTDPPYAFGLASMSQFGTKAGGWYDMMNNASWFSDRYKQWKALISDGPIWVFTNWRTLPILMKAAFDSGVGINSVLVWYKDWIGPGGTKGMRPTYELVAFTPLGDFAIPDRGVEDFVTVPWSSHKPTGHGAEKPAALLNHLLTVSGIPSAVDPFLGSGTTLVACEQTGRIGYGMEIEPKYCAVTLERLRGMGLEVRLVG